MDPKVISDWIAAILAREGCTHEHLAARAKVSAKTVGRLLAGHKGRSATVETLRRIAEAAGDEIPPGALRKHSGSGTARVPNVDPFGPTIPMCSFGPIPARLSLVKRGEIRLDRPEQLQGDGSAFAFNPPNDAFAPHARSGDLLFAHLAHPVAGDMTLAVSHEGRATLGYAVSLSEEGLVLDAPGGRQTLGLTTLERIAVVVLVVRRDWAKRIHWSNPSEGPSPESPSLPHDTKPLPHLPAGAAQAVVEPERALA